VQDASAESGGSDTGMEVRGGYDPGTVHPAERAISSEEGFFRFNGIR
jgi:hypothetical protein